MYDISFKFYGKTINVKQHLSNTKRSAVPWFDSVCKQSKSAFYSAKRKFSNDLTSENKEYLLCMRSEYMKAKRCARFKFYTKEKKNLARLSETSPRQFWNYIDKSKKKPSQQIDISVEEFAQYFGSFSKQGSNSDSSSGQNVTYTVNIDELDKSITILDVEKSHCVPKKV